MNTNSVLTNTKKMLGITDEYDAFDPDIIMHINSVLMILHQMGVLKEPKSIEDASTTWTDLVDNLELLQAIKTYMYAKVKSMFDPPTNSGAVTASENLIKELEYRLFIVNEFPT